MTDSIEEEEQRLFQIELQVGSITWAPTLLDQIYTGEPISICTDFQILDYPPLEICQDRFCAECVHGDVTFQTGKMIMFALKRSDLARLHNNFNIDISVVRMTVKASRFPFRTELATATMNISNDFSAILSTCFQAHVQHPSSKFINDEIDLTNNAGEVTGVMNLFLRLTTFGGTIMGHLYPDPDDPSGEVKLEQDMAAQALVTQTKVVACPKRYIQMLGRDKEPQYKEYRGSGEDNNMIGVRLYKLDPRIYKKPRDKSGKLNSCAETKPPVIEPGSLVLRGGEVVQQPDPGFSKSHDSTQVYYTMTSDEGVPSHQLNEQFITTPVSDQAHPITSVGPISGLPPDSKVDMYILRVGKKRVGHELKTHLEVELRTPKYMTRKKERFYKNTQYNTKDLESPLVPGQ